MPDTQISLVIPMFNSERHLKACLDSVVRQTFRGFECLCVDDGSTDNTASIVRELAAQDSRFKLLSQPNAGCSAARNRGMRQASAPYLFFLDADDVLHPQAFEILLRLIERHEADAASFQYIRVPDTFTLDSPERYAPDALQVTVETSPFRSFFSGKGRRESASACPRLYRASVLSGIAFPEGVHFAEDLVFVAKLMHRIRRLAATPATLLFYRDNPDSATNRSMTERQIRSYAQAARILHDHFRCEALSHQEARMVSTFISTLVYKTCAAPFLRDGEGLKQEALLNLSRGLVSDLMGCGAVDMRSLSLRKRLICLCFLRGWLSLARRLDSLVSRKGR